MTEVARAAKRLMGISAGRITDHFYTERVFPSFPCPCPCPSGAESSHLCRTRSKLVESVSGVTLAFTEEGMRFAPFG